MMGGNVLEKAGIGISVGMLAAGLYFLGLVSLLGLLVVGGYVLLFEKNAWLKRCAVKAVAIVIAFALLSHLVGLGNDVIQILNGILSWFRVPHMLSWPLSLNTIANAILHGLEFLILAFLGIKALIQGDVKVPGIDNAINKHM